MRFVMKPELTQDDLDLVKPVDLNCSKHISVVNDIYSGEKEYMQSLRSNEECSVLCSSVEVMEDEANVSLEAAKRILWSMCREWELVDFAEVKKLWSCKEDTVTYCKGLEFQMSGNEMWSRSTLRYDGKDL
ncbi:hypothetical protein BFW01_g12854 [Lasiodiplodia theobromae]|nr:hypothetical protein BFW01_g12854 [Lasiodiplodia theobromae]